MYIYISSFFPFLKDSLYPIIVSVQFKLIRCETLSSLIAHEETQQLLVKHKPPHWLPSLVKLSRTQNQQSPEEILQRMTQLEDETSSLLETQKTSMTSGKKSAIRTETLTRPEDARLELSSSFQLLLWKHVKPGPELCCSWSHQVCRETFNTTTVQRLLGQKKRKYRVVDDRILWPPQSQSSRAAYEGRVNMDLRTVSNTC